MKTIGSNEKGWIKGDKTALVVIDLQNGIVNTPRTPYSGTQVVQRARKLVDAFSEKGSFVVLVRVSSLDGKDMLNPLEDAKLKERRLPEGWDCLVPELAEVKNTYMITKRQWGAFYGTDLDLQLRRRGIDTIVLCGISSGIGVDTTAREAYQQGYKQIFVEDAMTANTDEEHNYVCNYIFPKIGSLCSSDEVIKSLI